jgi:surface protein
MFFKCTSLTSLNLSNFTTSKVNDMSKMFSKCTSLTSLDLSKFNTSKVKEMSKMFFDCTKLKVKTNDKKILALLKEIK